jgi:GNAT superfamily N-acetyltransferase
VFHLAKVPRFLYNAGYLRQPNIMAIEISEVKQVTEGLTEAINRLLPQLSPSHTLVNQDTLSRMVCDSASTLFVAGETSPGQSRIVGTVSLITFHTLAGIQARIEDLVVDKSVRGQGVGKALINKALAQARSFHARSVDLTSRAMRSQANQLYRHMGFFQRDTNVYRYDLTEFPETS